MPHPVVRWQIVSPDPEATAKFYRQLFGWQCSQDNGLGYRELNAGDGGIDGGVWPGPAGQHPIAQLFVEVPDVEEHIARATKLGAKVLVPASALPDGDVMAVLLDPTGLPFGICSTAKRGAPGAG
jgi:predicted enzyme related to lactoylglutathione lyase